MRVTAANMPGRRPPHRLPRNVMTEITVPLNANA